MTSELSARREALAKAFDASFAEPISDRRVVTRDYLVLRLEGRLFAIRVDELASVHKQRTIAPLPSPPRSCLGLAGVRGQVVVVYDFGELVGQGSARSGGWLLQSKKNPEVAFAVPEAERYLRAKADEFVPRETEGDDACVGALTEESTTLSVISLGRLVEAIASRLLEPGT